MGSIVRPVVARRLRRLLGLRPGLRPLLRPVLRPVLKSAPGKGEQKERVEESMAAENGGTEVDGKEVVKEEVKEGVKEGEVQGVEDSLQNLSIQPGNQPREDYLEWSEYFLAVSFLSAMRSKDPATQVGACIVNQDKRIVGIGYNGFPRGCPDDQLPWGKTSKDELENKYMYVCHAEMNAIMNKNASSVEGCTIYVALFPCNECAKMIIQAGIREVIYYSDKHRGKTSTIASKRLLDMAGVPYTQFVPKMKRIVIDFEAAE